MCSPVVNRVALAATGDNACTAQDGKVPRGGRLHAGIGKRAGDWDFVVGQQFEDANLAGVASALKSSALISYSGRFNAERNPGQRFPMVN